MPALGKTCGCECPTVPPYATPEEDHVLCLGFVVDEVYGTCVADGEYHGTWLQGRYNGRNTTVNGVNFSLAFVVLPDAVRLVLRINGQGGLCAEFTDGDEVVYVIEDATSTLRFPLRTDMLPLTLTIDNGDDYPDWPETITLIAEECPESLPMSCCETCDPAPCAYEMILDCVKGPFVPDTGNIINPPHPVYINNRVVFRQCDQPGCNYTALAPKWMFDWFQNTFCDRLIGLDWTGTDCTILGGASSQHFNHGAYANELPCRWSDMPIGYPPEYFVRLFKCLYAENLLKALNLDIAAGTITPTTLFDDWSLPSFPTYTVVGEWSCYGCNVFLIDPDQPNEWKIPDRVEVRAITENATGKCAAIQGPPFVDEEHCAVSGGPPIPFGGEYLGLCAGPPAPSLADAPLCGYGTKEERCNCCDPCCPCVAMWIRLTCLDDPNPPSVKECIINACAPPTNAPVGAAAGPGREGATVMTFTIGGYGHTVNVVFYCDGSPDGWKADWYLDDEFLDTTDLTACCCPFGLGGAGPASFNTMFPGCSLSLIVGGGCGGFSPPDCFDGIDEFDVVLEDCDLDIDETLHFVRVSRVCWEFNGLISCDRPLSIRICCASGSLVAKWFFPSACPQIGNCTVTGTPADTITLDCFGGVATACPPCGPCLPDQPLSVTCPTCSASTTVTPCIGGGNGLVGADSPSGDTYGACATLCGLGICVNWYHTGCQWKADVYNNGFFCFTKNLSHTCCPLALGVGSGDLCADSPCCITLGSCSSGGCTYEWDGAAWNLIETTCMTGCECSPAPTSPGTTVGQLSPKNCVPPDCEPPEPPEDLSCCPGVPTPATLTGIITSTCAALNGQVVTYVLTTAPNYQGTLTLGCGDVFLQGITLCSGDPETPYASVTGTTLKNSSEGTCITFGTGMDVVALTCDPLSLNTGVLTGADGGGGACDCGCVTTDTVSVDITG